MPFSICEFEREKKEFITLKALSEDDYNLIRSYIERDLAASQEVIYCIIVRDNLNEFFSMVSNYKDGDEKARFDYDRVLLNWINSFYCWIEFHENNYKDIFAPIKTKYYDNWFEYRFAYELRRYLTHGKMTRNMVGHASFLTGSFLLMVSDMIQNAKKMKPAIKGELIKDTKGLLDLEDFAEKFLIMFTQCQEETWESITAEAKEKSKQLKAFIETLPLSTYGHLLYEKTDDREGYSAIDGLPDTLSKIENRFLYPAWLLKHPKVDKTLCPYIMG